MNTIVSTAFIKNDKNKKVWEETNENCKDKDNEIIALIKKIIAYNSNNIYFITLNNKGFKDEYNKAHHLYNDLIKNKRIYSEDTIENIENIMKKIMATQDIGKLKDIGYVYKYYDIIQLNSKFMFV
jgi:transcription initiation factor IIE alpha subunit